MRRQELGPRKRQKRDFDEGEDSSQGSDGPASGEDSQSEGLSVLDEDDDDHDSAPDIPMQNEGEEATVPSRFSFKSRQDAIAIAKKVTVPPHASSPLPLTFAEMGVSSSLVSAMNKMSIHTPTEIQAACIPPLLNGMFFLTQCSVLNVEDFGKVGIV